MTTWNPSDKTSLIVLSNGDLTASNTAVSGYQHVRADTARSSGKHYFEMKNVTESAAVAYIGVRHISDAITSTSYTGVLNAMLNTTVAKNDVIGVAVNVTTGKIWLRLNNGLWQNPAGNPLISCDPVLDTNPSDTLDTAGDWLPFIAPNAGNSWTANFGGGGVFAYNLPEGYTAWDGNDTLNLLNIDPDGGATVGGTLITIAGTGFTSDTTVTIGGNAITGKTFVSATTITGYTPAGTAGAKDVVITRP